MSHLYILTFLSVELDGSNFQLTYFFEAAPKIVDSVIHATQRITTTLEDVKDAINNANLSAITSINSVATILDDVKDGIQELDATNLLAVSREK